MGTYRLLLALCVLYSHVFGQIAGWNIGVVAVISFFIISGYVMSLLIVRHYPDRNDLLRFYADRSARLFPQFLAYLALTLLAMKLVGFTDVFLRDVGPIQIALNALMLPLGFYMFGLEHALIIPPAWSLGLEVTFYIVFPFFLGLQRGAKVMAIAASVVVFCAAFAGFIDTDWFGYRLLPGLFFIFATGSALAQRKWPPALTLSFACGAMLLLLFLPNMYTKLYNKEVVAGIIVGIPAVYLLGRIPFSSFDELMGNLSYGVFLNHFLLLRVINHFDGSRMLVPLLSLGLAWISYALIERPALQLRRNLRRSSRGSRIDRGYGNSNVPEKVMIWPDTTG
ncbi:acyltransferase family protein [Bradyrhizobium oligotrophicum]|uniref:acyltransferase family protein n=1 Tax=Bradyrhizobium oligotrophicum TaxID=44255 RepID=UPI003EBF7F40